MASCKVAFRGEGVGVQGAGERPSWVVGTGHASRVHPGGSHPNAIGILSLAGTHGTM